MNSRRLAMKYTNEFDRRIPLDSDAYLGLLNLIEKVLLEQDKRTRHSCAEEGRKEVMKYENLDTTIFFSGSHTLSSNIHKACMNVNSFKEEE